MGSKISTVIFYSSSRFIAYRQDMSNIIKYGWKAPRYAERIWINARDCEWFLPSNVLKESFGVLTANASGMVINASWPVNAAYKVTDATKINCCIEHWSNGVPWEETGIYELIESRINTSNRGMIDGCRNKDDIVRRYQKMDVIFEQVKREGRLKTRAEISKANFREKGGVIIHIGNNGELFKGGRGVHRFAMAYVLNIPIPAQIGCVHVSAIPFLLKYRKELI